MGPTLPTWISPTHALAPFLSLALFLAPKVISQTTDPCGDLSDLSTDGVGVPPPRLGLTCLQQRVFKVELRPTEEEVPAAGALR